MADRKRNGGTPLLEWIVGGLGAIVFIGVLAVLIVNGVRQGDTPPSIHVEVERVSPVEGGYVLQFSARNEGETTAADIAVVARLRDGDGVEQRSARFDYLPPHSTRRGGFFFKTDPRQSALVLDAEGYNEP